MLNANRPTANKGDATGMSCMLAWSAFVLTNKKGPSHLVSQGGVILLPWVAKATLDVKIKTRKCTGETTFGILHPAMVPAIQKDVETL